MRDKNKKSENKSILIEKLKSNKKTFVKADKENTLIVLIRNKCKTKII